MVAMRLVASSAVILPRIGYCLSALLSGAFVFTVFCSGAGADEQPANSRPEAIPANAIRFLIEGIANIVTPNFCFLQACDKRTTRASNRCLAGSLVGAAGIALTIRQATETVEVVGGTPLLEPNTSEVGTTIDSQKVMDLPLNARNPMGLANLIPSVKGVGYFGNQILTFWRVGSIIVRSALFSWLTAPDTHPAAEPSNSTDGSGGRLLGKERSAPRNCALRTAPSARPTPAGFGPEALPRRPRTAG